MQHPKPYKVADTPLQYNKTERTEIPQETRNKRVEEVKAMIAKDDCFHDQNLEFILQSVKGKSVYTIGETIFF